MILFTTVNEVAEDYRVIVTHETHTHTHTHTHTQSINQSNLGSPNFSPNSRVVLYISLSLSLSKKKYIFLSFHYVRSFCDCYF